MNDAKIATRLIPLNEWNRYHVWPPIGGLRHLAFNRDKNGFGRAFVKVGRRLLIDEAEFFKIARQQGSEK